ncbi:hypothetical protein GCM10010246_04170 [Streptomyces cuspidosporus]|uniref:Uncharacterized protein n=1 Tax=Streptomyces cuspidosporus TaxID=66882 RepID=A0ABN3FAU1_9ACTN
MLGERMYAAAVGRAGVRPCAVIPVRVPVLPDGIEIRDATEADAAPLEPVIRMADRTTPTVPGACTAWPSSDGIPT